MTWGIEAEVIERFGGAGVHEEQISFERDRYVFRFAGCAVGSPSTQFKTYDGPTMNAYAAAAANGRETELDAELGRPLQRAQHECG